MSRNFLVPILLPADPANALEAATKQYVDAARTSAGRIFYLTNDASDIATYYKALEAPSSGAQATFTATVSGTLTDFLLAAWATEPGVPGIVVYPAGTAYRRIFVNLAGGNTARLHLQVYIRTAAGVETLARDEFSPNFTNTTVALNEWLTTAASAGAMATDDRLVLKLYAQRVAGGGSFLVTMYVEGTTNASHIQTTIIGGSTGSSLYVSKSGDTMTGPLTLPADPTTALQAATKQYVDAAGGGGGGSVSGTKLSALTALTGANAASTDLVEVLDVSDTTMAASGTNKKMTLAQLVVWLNANGITIADGDKGEISVTSGVWTIDANAITNIKMADGAVGTAELVDDAVTYAKIQNVSTASRVLGRATAGAGDVEEIIFTTQAQQLSDDNSFAAMRTTLGLVIGTDVAPARRIVNADITTAFAPSVAHENVMITLSNASAITVTLPSNATTAFPVGAEVDFLWLGAGQPTFVAGSGATVNGTPGLKLRAQYSAATAKKVSTNGWVVIGDLSA